MIFQISYIVNIASSVFLGILQNIGRSNNVMSIDRFENVQTCVGFRRHLSDHAHGTSCTAAIFG